MRMLGITIPEKKHLKIGLTEVYGVGVSRAAKILKDAGVDPQSKPADVSADQEKKIREGVESFTLEGNLRREQSRNIKRLKDIQSYRGARHQNGLPVRGQRTKTNSRTVRGNKRVTMGSGRRKVEKT